MHCQACGTENRADRKFCAACGAALAVVCSSCGAANLPGERFCGECGSALTTGAAPAAGGALTTTAGAPRTAVGAPTEAGAPPLAGTPIAERRLVTVLFADLVDFTGLSEAADIETVRDLQAIYFDRARATVERYGGTVEKYIGDAVMAVWGTPVAHEDDAERAVRAGLELMEAVGALGDGQTARPLAARAAVATGEAAVTIGAVGQGMVTGDLVNTAARLQAASAPGTVLVTEETERSARAAIAFEPVGRLELKGRAEPVSAWRATRVIAGRGGAGRSEGVEAPFVGRVAELRSLKEALAATSEEGRARLVTVVGPAGIGKSRLAWELEKYVDGITETIYWHRGRSPAYGDGVAYWALGEMVRERARIAETDDPLASAAKLDAMLGEYLADATERAWLAPHLRTLLGLDEQAGGDRTEQFAAWRRLFEAIAERGTTVLVFEDLHWADDGLLDFIEAVLEWSRERPIMVVALARPELLERRPAFGAASRNALRIHLDPMSTAEMVELLAALAPELVESSAAAIVERSEGIPLYAIELVRMLRGPDGRLAEPSGPGAIRIPPTLQALVAARLDALEPDHRALVQTAAVLGQTFTIGSLAAIGDRSVADLEPVLRSLVRREVLTPVVDARSPERGQYGFVQSVIREVAASTLSRRDLRDRHLAAARYFETLGDDELAPVLAAHYLDAYRAGPDDEQGRAVRAQAKVALRAAADRAGRLHNYEQAIRALAEALELTDERPERATLLMRQAELAEAAGSMSDATAIGELARSTFEALDDAPGTRRATALIGRVELKIGRIDEAMVSLGRALEGADPATDPEGYARLASEFARAHMLSDRWRDGLGWTERALEAAGPIRSTELIAEAMNTRGVLLQGFGRLDEGMALIRASMELAGQAHLSNAELRARYNLGGRLFSDDPRGGAEIIAGAVELATRTGRRDWQAMSASFLALFQENLGEWDAAMATARSVVEAMTTQETMTHESDAIALVGAIEAWRGDREAWPRAAAILSSTAALESDTQRTGTLMTYAASVATAEGRLTDAIRETGRVSEGNWRYQACLLRARAAIRLGDLDTARAAAAEIEYREELGRLRDLQRLGIEAGIAALEGRRDAAVAGYQDAARGLRALEVLPDVADLLLDAVHALGPDDPAVPGFADEARAIWERLGARAQLDRLDDALAKAGRGALSSAAPSASRAPRAGSQAPADA